MASLWQKIVDLSGRVLAVPTAPYREQRIRDFIIDFCKQRSLNYKQDEVGNLIVTYGGTYKNAVFGFAAHMDHPGFIAEKDSARHRLTALFYGGVNKEYFKGARAVFFTDNGPVKAVVTKTEFEKQVPRRRCWLRTEGPIPSGTLGMWDLPACRIRGDRLSSRACDDLVGCISVLSLLDELHRRRIRKKVLAIFTVAEEAAFQGAIHLCVHKRIPKSTHLIAIETSSALPTATIGDGVVIRVGDRRSIFTPGLTAFLADAAQALQSRDTAFRYQRKLMDGGVCESTVYNTFGCTNAAVCIPLGNYHNRNRRTKKIAAEYVSLSDLENMVKLFLSVVRNSEKAKHFLKNTPPEYQLETGHLGEFFYHQQKPKSHG
jgi:putative aminopeptidase FrvX